MVQRGSFSNWLVIINPYTEAPTESLCLSQRFYSSTKSLSPSKRDVAFHRKVGPLEERPGPLRERLRPLSERPVTLTEKPWPLKFLLALNYCSCVPALSDTMYIQCTVITVQCTIYNVQCAVCSMQCTVYILKWAVRSIQCTVYSAKSEEGSAQ